MSDRDPVIIKHVDRIAGCIFLALLLPGTGAIGLHTGDEYTTDLEFSGTIDQMRGALDCIRIIMTRRVVTYRDNIRSQFERVVTDCLAIEWICHHRGVIALGETKTRMSVPGNFHETVASNRYYTRSEERRV